MVEEVFDLPQKLLVKLIERRHAYTLFCSVVYYFLLLLFVMFDNIYYLQFKYSWFKGLGDVSVCAILISCNSVAGSCLSRKE